MLSVPTRNGLVTLMQFNIFFSPLVSRWRGHIFHLAHVLPGRQPTWVKVPRKSHSWESPLSKRVFLCLSVFTLPTSFPTMFTFDSSGQSWNLLFLCSLIALQAQLVSRRNMLLLTSFHEGNLENEPHMKTTGLTEFSNISQLPPWIRYVPSEQ